MGYLLVVGLLMSGLAGCAPDSPNAVTPACGLVSPDLVEQAVPDLPRETSTGVGLIRDGDSITIDPDDAQGAECTQSSATDSGNALSIRITAPTEEGLDRLRAKHSDAESKKETCEPLGMKGAIGSTCLVDGPSKPVVHVYSIWDSYVISIDLSRSEGPAADDRTLAAAIAQSVEEHLE
ncbi:hypothetical protein [Agreia bicolorata]|uniref:hypothetical protein n=1 Tax=Agreia bicolorata TaxID=110935 RepID=UPI00126A3D3A|nr:hypothetical protein [Agreia bicolorata]